MARLKQKTLKLAREEYLKNQSKEDESLEITMEKATCPKCRGDGKESSGTHIQDLCPADRMKITQLISELARCTQEKHKVEADLAVSKAENEALQNQFQMLNNQLEGDKNKLFSQLSSTRAEMNKLKLQTSYALKLLTHQIMALERQSRRLVETVKDLLNDKMHLQDALVNQKMRVQILEGRIKKIKNSKNVKKLLQVNQQMMNKVSLKFDKDCQTEALENLPEIYTYSGLKVSRSSQDSHRCTKTTQIKSKRDLDESSTEAILLRELFFKRPSIDENEGLELLTLFQRN
ncbi:uncharacterized protein LOC107224057 [Neodiprion lecontei]|uniref:Uncharacterized protein LOC107224057 n=3 Tax=Neodiprion TaxID=270857 RepID=A0A6J0BX21_NEOLC|nr:uncharacterized protein LOC107224057 [Neodiprion lecontei]XP_046472646.1 uncharacterized protein LOC124214421 [Neodiprion pinetum]